MHGGLVKIRIAAPAADNAANRALIEFVARRLGVSKHSVRIVSGAASRRKMLEVEEESRAMRSPPGWLEARELIARRGISSARPALSSPLR